MKKTLAITAFLIFFFSQFGKVINFCLCEIIVYKQTSSFFCDCDKRLVSATDAEKRQHNHPNAVSIQQEELFHRHNSMPFTCTRFTSAIIYISGHTTPLYEGYYTNVFHPPGTV